MSATDLAVLSRTEFDERFNVKVSSRANSFTLYRGRCRVGEVSGCVGGLRECGGAQGDAGTAETVACCGAPGRGQCEAGRRASRQGDPGRVRGRSIACADREGSRYFCAAGVSDSRRSLVSGLRGQRCWTSRRTSYSFLYVLLNVSSGFARQSSPAADAIRTTPEGMTHARR